MFYPFDSKPFWISNMQVSAIKLDLSQCKPNLSVYINQEVWIVGSFPNSLRLNQPQISYMFKFLCLIKFSFLAQVKKSKTREIVS